MTAPLLTVDNLRIEVARTGEAIVDDVSFHIWRGEFMAVVGESGSGKTLAARSVLGLLPQKVARLARTGGRHGFPGADGVAQSGDQRRRADG